MRPVEARSTAPKPKRIEPREAFAVILENDAFANEDTNYSSGFGLLWATDDIRRYDDDSFYREFADFWSPALFRG